MKPINKETYIKIKNRTSWFQLDYDLEPISVTYDLHPARTVFCYRINNEYVPIQEIEVYSESKDQKVKS